MAPDEPKPKATVVREQYDWTAISPASAVVETISRALDCEPTSFGPLYDYIDPDALDAVVGTTGLRDAARSTVVSFLFEAHEVAVHGSGDVVVRTNALADT